MAEHYTKNTVSATLWCAKCRKATEHRVDNGRRGPCNACIAELERTSKEARDKPPEPTQSNLF